jgi:hypothetical protein
MEALVGQGQPTGDLPSEVPPKLDGRLPVRQPRQRLHHHDRGHLVGRNQRPTTTRGEQVSEQLVREQVPAMVGQEGIPRALIDQVAAQSRRIQQLDTTGISCPLHAGSLPHHSPTSWDPASYLLSRLLGEAQLLRSRSWPPGSRSDPGGSRHGVHRSPRQRIDPDGQPSKRLHSPLPFMR